MVLLLTVAVLTGTPPPESFLSYGRLPTWTGVAVDWEKQQPRVDLYSPSQYQGHAEYVSRGLKTGITFRTFKAQVRDPATRKYVPFFLYDLSGVNIARAGTRRLWAVRLEDYSYRDTDAQMTAAVLRLMATLQRTRKTPGLVVLAKSLKSKPNRGIAPQLEAAGVSWITLQGLLDASGARAVEVLNPGEAVGTLRIAEAGKLHQFGPRDIVIFKTLPKRVPPVGGIITLAAQTPLSHVNLLAKNRGTPNLYALSMDKLPGAHRQVNRLVRLKASSAKVVIEPLSLRRAERFWAKHPPKKVTIPEPVRGIRGVIDLNKGIHTTDTVGAKAANYARLRRLLPKLVRPGYALGFEHYFEVVEAGEASAVISRFLADRSKLDPKQLRERLRGIRRAIFATKVPPRTMLAIRRLLAGPMRHAKKIRLRSSTNCEDLAHFNGAGLYRSSGFWRHREDNNLQRGLQRVYASLWRPQAFLEREYFGIDHRRAAMAVLINEAFVDEAANGVILTIPGKPPTIWVNAQPGSRLVTNPAPGEIPEAFRFRMGASPPGKVITASSIGPVFVGRPGRKALLQELATATAQVHKALTAGRTGFGVDIEFKIMGRRLFFKQARLLHPNVP